MDLAHPMDPPRIEQDPLGGRGLTSINVGHDADIPEPMKWSNPGHRLTISSLFSFALMCQQIKRNVETSWAGFPAAVSFYLLVKTAGFGSLEGR
jgi:hypothetical protein